MRNYFYTIVNFIDKQLNNDEVYLCEFTTERSDFIRFNKGNIRQPGNVEQLFIALDLIKGNRHINGQLTLSGEIRTDRERIIALFSELRDQLPHLPEDPYLLYATEINSSELEKTNILPDAKGLLPDILSIIQGIDFVGIYAVGGIFTGFANSFGQRNWHNSYSFNFDWSIYHERDKAVKSAYAGFKWDTSIFQEKIANSIVQLDLLRREPRTIEPGQYRVYLSPTALYEILQLLTWGGFGLKAQRTKKSPLLRMLEEPVQHLHPSITLTENTAQGIAPTFQSQGFIKPEQITLIEKGVYHTALVSPRSAKEYGTETNGANEEEMPCSLDLAAGDLPQADVLKKLDKGIYINNLWYLNYSDRAACRITGMTRFATFWVENGEIQAPLNVMRFDETLYRLLGDNLIALTAERDFIIEADTYEVRSTNSARLPGALIEAFTFTL
jgi:predicted Zn-dependent protease